METVDSPHAQLDDAHSWRCCGCGDRPGRNGDHMAASADLHNRSSVYAQVG